ncbi:conserved hypothetical protein [Neisseria gonorrhoeae DGI2]|uniref:Uncharacterized protein n=1 Tax=Neisseria gonorrhoeae (strain NCCP11945) TaxID=521006 RepID=B4RP03_NEIG2|nr:Hypothetical protein NGK_0081 [Neisseria gonorrhoeae NCCP11945]EFE03518.1 conserved hypothetical protein [Neisseria gonorrhoeae DGI2]
MPCAADAAAFVFWERAGAPADVIPCCDCGKNRLKYNY